MRNTRYDRLNRWAASHGLLVAALAAWLPGLSPFGRRALAVLSVMPLTMSLISDTSSGDKAQSQPERYKNRSASTGTAQSRTAVARQ